MKRIPILFFVFAFFFTTAHAWTGPTGTPPANNAGAPITTGFTGQTKQGGLHLGAGQFDGVKANGTVDLSAWLENGLLVVGVPDPTFLVSQKQTNSNLRAVVQGDILANKICFGDATTANCYNSFDGGVWGGSAGDTGTPQRLLKWNDGGLAAIDSDISNPSGSIRLGSDATSFLTANSSYAPLVSVRKTSTGLDTDVRKAAFFASSDAKISPFLVQVGTSGATATSSIAVAPNGNVGLGLSLPSAQLHVQGNALVSGSLGIGTTNPAAKVDVSGGNVRANGALMGIHPTYTSYTAWWKDGSDYSLLTNGTHTFLNAPVAAGNIYLRTANAEKVFIEGSSGDVGIGNTNPTAKLDVTGSIKATGGNVTALKSGTVGGDVTGTRLCIGTDCRATWPSGDTYTAGTGIVINGSDQISIASGYQLPQFHNTNCPAGKVLKMTASGVTGNWTCDTDATGTYTAAVNGGLSLSGTAFSVADSGVTTARIANDAITSAKIDDGVIMNEDIASNAAIALSKLNIVGTGNSSNFLRGDGTWAAPTATVIHDTTLTGSGTSASNLAIAAAFKLPTGCAATRIPKWNGSIWDCAVDETGFSGVTLASNSGLTGNGTSGNGLAVSAVTGAMITDATIADADIASNAAIAASKIAGYPNDSSRYLRGDGTWAVVSGSGDITGVIAGTGLTGGGTSGTVTISADTAYLQRRVSASCGAGSSIRVIAADGTVTCETDDVGTGGITSESDPKVGTSLSTGNVALWNGTTLANSRIREGSTGLGISEGGTIADSGGDFLWVTSAGKMNTFKSYNTASYNGLFSSVGIDAVGKSIGLVARPTNNTTDQYGIGVYAYGGTAAGYDFYGAGPRSLFQGTVTVNGTLGVNQKITSAATVSGDSATTVTTKGYVDGKVDSVISAIDSPQGTWCGVVTYNNFGGIGTTQKACKGIIPYSSCPAGYTWIQPTQNLATCMKD